MWYSRTTQGFHYGITFYSWIHFHDISYTMSGIIQTNHCSLCNMYDMSCVLHFSGTGISLSVLAVGFLLSAQASPPVNFYPSDPTSNSTCAQYGWVGQYLICAITVWMGGFPPLIEYNNMSRCTLVRAHTLPDFVNSVCWIQTVAFVTMRMAQRYQTLPVSPLIQPTQSKQQVAGLFLSLKSLILSLYFSL